MQKLEVQLISLEKSHLEQAARLAADRHRIEKGYLPLLPEKNEDINSILPLLQDFLGKYPGVVAICEKRLAGFLIGQKASLFHGRRGVYVPEWAHGAVLEDKKFIYQSMYAYMAKKWVGNGCFTHAISFFAHDDPAIQAFQWMGFGITVVDALRDLSPIDIGGLDLEIRRVGEENIEDITSLRFDLLKHLASAPAFLPLVDFSNCGSYEKWFNDSKNAFWLAYHHDRPVSVMGFERSRDAKGYAVRDEQTVNITNAYTRPDLRRRGIGVSVLNHALKWASRVGYSKCAVDFESANLLGSAFWLKHFKPYCLSLVRHVDERIAWAHGGREVEEVW